MSSHVLIVHRGMQQLRAFGPASEERLLRLAEQKRSEDPALSTVVAEVEALPSERREGTATNVRTSGD